MTTESPTRSDSLADLVYVDDLTGEVCRTLLASHHVGRIAFVGHDGFPVVLPVNYTVAGDDVVVRTDRGEMYESVPLHRVAFEVDEFNEAVNTGRSLLIRGGARDVTRRPSSAAGRAAPPACSRSSSASTSAPSAHPSRSSPTAKRAPCRLASSSRALSPRSTAHGQARKSAWSTLNTGWGRRSLSPRPRSARCGPSGCPPRPVAHGARPAIVRRRALRVRTDRRRRRPADQRPGDAARCRRPVLVLHCRLRCRAVGRRYRPRFGTRRQRRRARRVAAGSARPTRRARADTALGAGLAKHCSLDAPIEAIGIDALCSERAVGITRRAGPAEPVAHHPRRAACRHRHLRSVVTSAAHQRRPRHDRHRARCGRQPSGGRRPRRESIGHGRRRPVPRGIAALRPRRHRPTSPGSRPSGSIQTRCRASRQLGVESCGQCG
jgi:Pyridoxamine 5'-phosphate oxidase